ncbi:MAG: DUF3080 family protein [Pseudomonadota bacterium]
MYSLNERISSTLNTQLASLDYQPRPEQMPPVRDLKPVGSVSSMNFLTSLRLGHCQAGQLIAERNSSLGRLEDGLMRYQKDIQLLAALDQCAAHPQSAQIQQDLITAINAKKAQANYDLAVAAATDDALRNALSFGTQALRHVDEQQFTADLAALKQLAHWLQQPAPNSELAVWREQLVQSDYLGRLYRSVVQMRFYLTQLERHLPDLPEAAGCNTKGVPQRATVLKNVFLTFFIEQLQPTLAQLTQQYQQLQPVFGKLQRQLPQPELKKYVKKLSEQGQLLADSSKSFVQPWQQLFKACEFTPGQ